MTVDAEHYVRELEASDLDDVVAIDAALTGERKEKFWLETFAQALGGEAHLGLASIGANGLDGYVFGELRAFEFGSDACGWITVVGVRPETTRKGIASSLIDEARRRFAALGAKAVRTMVRRTDVPLLSLFRSQGFVGGPFVQLELDITETAG